MEDAGNHSPGVMTLQGWIHGVATGGSALALGVGASERAAMRSLLSLFIGQSGDREFIGGRLRGGAGGTGCFRLLCAFCLIYVIHFGDSPGMNLLFRVYRGRGAKGSPRAAVMLVRPPWQSPVYRPATAQHCKNVRRCCISNSHWAWLEFPEWRSPGRCRWDETPSPVHHRTQCTRV